MALYRTEQHNIDIDRLQKQIKKHEANELKSYELWNQTMEDKHLEEATRQGKLKDNYLKLLQKKIRLINDLNIRETGRIQSMFADTEMTPEREERAKKRKELRQQNGSIPEMSNRACYTKCQKKSLCTLSGLCDRNYYCKPVNRKLTGPEPDTEIQRCQPPESKKNLGGRKMTNKKNKRLMRKRKTYRRKPNKRKTLKSRKRKQTRYRK
jgi:hypothetical protein